MLFVTSCIFSGSLIAQTWQEWFQQKKTQKKYLFLQIAALKVHLSYVKKGYDIANKGINIVHTIKQGDFKLHRDFLASLKQVNPKIKNYSKIPEIIGYQSRIIKITRKSLLTIRASKQFTTVEMDYCKQVFDNLLNECAKTIDDLFLVVTSQVFEMKDDERLQRIDKLYVDSQDKYAFCLSFKNETELLSAQRLPGRVEIDQSKIINALK